MLMRVIMLSWEYPPKIVGGISRHVYDLAHALTAQGVEVHVVTCEHPGAAEEEVEDGLHKSLAHKSLAHKSLAHKSLAHKSLAHKEQETRKPRVLDGEAEACLVALTCGTPPEGQARWSLRLLKDALIEQQIVDAIGKETVRQTLKKTRLNRG